MTRLRALFVSLFLVALTIPLVAKQRAVQHPRPNSGPTFNREVVRIFQDNCQTCHHEGDIAPFGLVTYAESKKYAPLIKFMTQTRQMPPWKPTEGCGEFLDERRLSQAEIDTIVQWVNDGAPEGNPADLPAPLIFSSAWRLGEPDMVISSPEPFTAPEGKDTYRCFTVPTNLTSTAYVSAVDTHPGDRESVHHVISFVDTTGASVKLDEAEPGPGYTCFGGPGFDGPGTLGGWAPGSAPLQMPEDVAFELPAASRVVLQVHYHPHHGAPEPDQTEIGIYFAKKKPRATMLILPIINQQFTIPPGASSYAVEGTLPYVPGSIMPLNAKLWFVAPHMHLLGKTMQVQMKPPNGPAQCLININDWDFNWQGSYMYREPITIPAGTKLWLNATYDNSENNPRNPNSPPKPVSWGEATTDEMCIAFIGVTLE